MTNRYYQKNSTPHNNNQLSKVSDSVLTRATNEHVDGTYAMLLRRHLTLSDSHRAALRARGLTDAEIRRNGYASTPTASQAIQVARSLADYGLDGVPGFYRTRDGWRMVDYGSGFLVPVRNTAGRIAGIQIRRDAGSPKYLWLSSSSHGGASSGSPVHFANRHLLPAATSLLITEGALKADIAGFLLGQAVVAAAGVGNFGSTFAEDLRETCPKLRTAIVGFDMDWTTKKGVRDAQTKLIKQLEAQGFDVLVRTWPPEFKGIDDYLLTASRGKGRAAA